MIDSALLNKLICINCDSPDLNVSSEGLICNKCSRKIGIRSGIPDFLSTYQIGQVDWKSVDFGSYERVLSTFKPYRLEKVDRPLIDNCEGDVLEIGCGTCRLAKEAEKKGARYFGLDPSLSMLQYAQENYGLNRLVCGQGEKLPFKNEAFDSITSGFYAYRYVNPDLGLSEARRVIKKGKKFAFDLLNYWILELIKLKSRIKRRNFEEIFDRKYSQHSEKLFEFVNFSKLKEKTDKAGFLIEEVFSLPIVPAFPSLNKYLRKVRFYNKASVFLGYDVVIILKAV